MPMDLYAFVYRRLLLVANDDDSRRETHPQGHSYVTLSGPKI